MTARYPPQPPVDIPDHLHHGSSYVHRHYRCRCEQCQEWRRSYDQARNDPNRHGRPEYRSRLRPGGWYDCVDVLGEARGHHLYTAFGTCRRCGASQQEEQHWNWIWDRSAP